MNDSASPDSDVPVVPLPVVPPPSNATDFPPCTENRLHRYRRPLRWSLAVLLILLTLMSGIYGDVRRTGGTVYTDPAAAPALPVAIVFGAGYGKSGPSAMLYDRVATGVTLYKLGKARKLLMTGDNGKSDYNEPAIMRKTALSLGVPDRDIVLDFAGFRTYDSLYRAKAIFGVTRAILVTQAYHLPRALFTAKALGLETVGVAADRGHYAGQIWRDLREVTSVENAWIAARVLHPRPKFLGRPEPIFPSNNPAF